MAKNKNIDYWSLKRAHEMVEVEKWWNLAVKAIVNEDDAALARAVKKHRNAMARLQLASDRYTELKRKAFQAEP